MSNTGLSVHDLVKAFEAFTLGPLSIDFVPGRAYGLLGPNGAGKTTLLNVLALQLRPTHGEIRYRGVPIRWGDTTWKERFAYIKETPAFYDELTVGQTLQLASRLYRSWDHASARTLLQRLELDPAHRVATLSKGTAVKLGLVAALAHRAEILILDEPTAGLDPTVRLELLNTLATLKDEQPELCLLLSSHIFEDIEHLADEVVIIKGGRIVLQQDERTIPNLAAAYHGASA